MKYFLALFFLIFLLTGCASAPVDVSATVMAAIAQTQTAMPGPTDTPTLSPPTFTPAPTATLTPLPLTLSGSNRLLVDVFQCLPAGDVNCQAAYSGIYIVDPQGREQKQLATGGDLLSLSLDGQQALVSEYRPQGGGSLSVLNLADGRLTVLTQMYLSDYACDVTRCAAIWSADGKSVFFISIFNNEIHVFSINADGSGLMQVTWPGSNPQPVYLYTSGNLERVYWERGSKGILEGLVSARRDGAEQANIPGLRDPAFSPRGESVAYQKAANDLGFQDAFYVGDVNFAGETLVYAPQMDEYISHYAWSPDGSKLIFGVAQCASQCQPSRLYLWGRGENSPQEVANVSGILLKAPVWSADGGHILFHFYEPTTGQHFYRALTMDGLVLQPVLEGINLPAGSYVDDLIPLP